MSWKGLTASGPPKGNTALEQKCEILQENEKKLRKEMRSYKLRISDLEASAKEFAETHRNLEKTHYKLVQETKFDRIAHEGIAKKAAVHEYEAVALKEERANLVELREQNTKRIKELELALNDVRAKRLKETHENDRLKSRCATLEAELNHANRSAQEANERLLEKLQKIDTLQVYQSARFSFYGPVKTYPPKFPSIITTPMKYLPQISLYLLI
jgi:hypothetical protein